MQRIFIETCVVIAFLGMASIGASAQSNSTTGSLSTAATSAAGSRDASFCGTVVTLTEANCIGVKSSMLGQPILYEITSATPKPKVGTLIAGTGTTGGVSFCMQGTHLSRVVWKQAVACPLTNSAGK
jgi:hypothetical protein